MNDPYAIIIVQVNRIFKINFHNIDNSKLFEKIGRKTMGLRVYTYDCQVAEFRETNYIWRKYGFFNLKEWS